MSYGTLQIEKMTTESGYSLGAGNASSFKNRIINGGMVIDQRNAGAAVTNSNVANNFPIDRTFIYGSVSSRFTAQQSSIAPAGFTRSVVCTSSAATSLGASDYYQIAQHIEGFNVADLGWGTANAKTVTLSFWVRSSLTGTFGGVIGGVNTRSYPFTYTINSANTFEYKTITIPGDTSGTWGTTNGFGILVSFSLGTGSTFSGTAGSWSGSTLLSATGATSVVGTNGATFYITGVQLEVGSTATSFDYRPYGTELALCQRYYEKSYAIGTVPGTATTAGAENWTLTGNASANALMTIRYKVQKRAAPTMTAYRSDTGATGSWQWYNSGGSGNNGVTFDQTADSGTRLYLNASPFAYTGCEILGHWVASIEL